MQNIVHFVGFRGAEFVSAVKVWGKPDMIHRNADPRFWADVAAGDIVVFANGAGDPHRIRRHRDFPSFNDSNHF